MKRGHQTLLASLALTAAAASWSQDATIVNARILVGDGPVIDHGYIVVQQGSIVTVGPGRPAQLAGDVIDASGMTAIPGLIDGHKHINTGPFEKQLMADILASGFTTVLSGGGPADGNRTLAEHIDSGLINGPRVLPSAANFALNLTPDQGRAMIRQLAAQGIRFTGEMVTTPVPSATDKEVALLRAVADEGKKAGVEPVIHAVSTPSMVAATQAGIRRQVHLPNKDFMSYTDAAYIADSGTIVLDLISFGDPIIDVFQKDDIPRFRSGLRWPEAIAGANRDDGGRATGTEGAYTLINARRLWDASHGKGLGFGSDQEYRTRDVLEHELKSLLVMFSMQDVIRIMTLNTAAFLNMQNEIGSLEPGKRADIVLVQGNPLQDSNDLLNTMVVLKNGHVVFDQRAGRAATEQSTPTDTPSGSPMVGTLTASMARPDQAPVMRCSQLGGTKLALGRAQSAKDVAANSIPRPASAAYDEPPGMTAVPGHCEVVVQLRTSTAAADAMQVWLPNAAWSANLLVLGSSPVDATALNEALAKGYAVASLGQRPEPAHRAQPFRHEEAAEQAVHDGVVSAKALIAAYYGGAVRYSYWESSSADIAPGLRELQRYPSDFDGVVLGASDGTPSAATGNDFDLASFATRGGKIIEYHGGAGQAAAAGDVSKRYDSTTARFGGLEHTRGFYRLFELGPGQQGDFYQVDWIHALDEWVQRAGAPDVVLANHLPPPGVPVPTPPPGAVVFEPKFGVHTVCAYPFVAQRTGVGRETPLDYICLPANQVDAVSDSRP